MAGLIKVKVTQNQSYQTINIASAQDPNLSWMAKGIHYYLLTNPSNTIDSDKLSEISTGEVAVWRSGLRELQSRGYVYIIAKKDADESITDWEYLVCESSFTPKQAARKLSNGWSLHKEHLYKGNQPLAVREPKSAEPSKDAEQLIEFWNTLPNVQKIRNRASKTRDKAITAITKKLKKYSYQDICNVFKVYNELLEKPEYIEPPKGVALRVGLADFFCPTAYTRKKKGEFVCWFNECLPGQEPYDKFKKYQVEDKYPKCTQAIKDRYIKEKGLVRPRFTGKQEDQFRMAAVRVKEMEADLRKKAPSLVTVPRGDMSPFLDIMFNSLNETFDEINTGNLSSNYTWEKVIPKQIVKIGLTK